MVSGILFPVVLLFLVIVVTVALIWLIFWLFGRLFRTMDEPFRKMSFKELKKWRIYSVVVSVIAIGATVYFSLINPFLEEDYLKIGKGLFLLLFEIIFFIKLIDLYSKYIGMKKR